MQAVLLRQQLCGCPSDVAQMLRLASPQLRASAQACGVVCASISKLAIAVLRYSFEDPATMDMLCMLFRALLVPAPASSGDDTASGELRH